MFNIERNGAPKRIRTSALRRQRPEVRILLGAPFRSMLNTGPSGPFSSPPYGAMIVSPVPIRSVPFLPAGGRWRPAFSSGICSKALWLIASAPRHHLIQRRPPQEAPRGDHRAYPPTILNVGKRIGAEEYKVGSLPNVDAAARPLKAKEDSRVDGGRLKRLERGQPCYLPWP